MVNKITLITLISLIFISLPIQAKKPCICKKPQVQCCSKQMGISYCDSTAGRYVCNNGEFSQCYCKKTAVMDLQNVMGCCTWKGGVLKTELGKVMCRNGEVSKVCSTQFDNSQLGIISLY